MSMEAPSAQVNTAAITLDGGSGTLSSDTRSSFDDWIVAGHQVGAEWQHAASDDSLSLRHLGGSSPVNAKDGSLCLWIGFAKQREELLILLTFSVTLRKGSRASPRRLFLLVPAEYLRITSKSPTFESVALDQVPESLFERPSDARSALTNGFLHVMFSLGSKHQSKVIMPTRPYDGRINGTAFSLVDGLKSLSETRTFSLYMKFNSYAQLGFQHIQARMASCTTPLKTPVFKLDAMYRGGRDGGFNLWEAQGWHDEECAPKELKSRKRRLSQESGKLAPHMLATPECEPPPAYDDASEPPKSRLPHGTQSIGHDSVAVARSCTPENIAGKALSVTSQTSKVPETPHFEPPPPSTLCSGPQPLLPSRRFYMEMPNWLRGAWASCPYAHYMFVLELVAAGAAARREDLDGYHRARVACTARLISCEAEKRVGEDFYRTLASRRTDMANAYVGDEPSNLISWMMIVEPTADSVFIGLLIELEKRRKRVLKSRASRSDSTRDHSDEDDYTECLGRFMDIKALIVVEVCFQYGAAALEAKDQLAEAMIREMNHQLGRPAVVLRTLSEGNC